MNGIASNQGEKEGVWGCVGPLWERGGGRGGGGGGGHWTAPLMGRVSGRAFQNFFKDPRKLRCSLALDKQSHVRKAGAAFIALWWLYLLFCWHENNNIGNFINSRQQSNVWLHIRMLQCFVCFSPTAQETLLENRH